MPDTSNIGTMVAIVGSAIGTVITMLTFWTRLTDRIAKAKEVAERAEAKADVAQQEAAEAKNDSDNVRELLDQMIRDLHDRIERIAHDTGETVAALRQHSTQIELYMRDNFVREPAFASARKEIKDSQASMEKKLDDIRDRLPRRN